MALTGYYSAQDLIIQRIKDKVPGLKAVLGDMELSAINERQQLTPAVHVVIDHEEPGGSAGQGLAQRIPQRWLVVVAVRNTKDAVGGMSAKAQADALLLAVAEALQGFQPSPDHGPLLRNPPPKPGFSDGFAYFPLSYTSPIQIIGEG